VNVKKEAVKVEATPSSGDTKVENSKKEDVEIVTLDSDDEPLMPPSKRPALEAPAPSLLGWFSILLFYSSLYTAQNYTILKNK